MLLASGLALLQPAMSQAQSNDELKALIQELDQKIRVLERKQEIERETAAEKSKTAANVSIGASGFQVRSGDSNFLLKVRGYVQVDGRFYADQSFPASPSTAPGRSSYPASATDTFLLRRVRPIIEGTVFEKYDYRLMLDFGQNINSTALNNGFVQDAYVQGRFLPEFQVFAGKLKEPVGLERLQSGANLAFVERGLPTQLVPNRDVGAGLQGEFGEGVLNYAVGAFNGVADGGSGDFDFNEDEKDVAARVFAHPFKSSGIAPLKGLGLGVGGTFGHQEGALRSYFTPGTQRFFTYHLGAGTNAARPNVVADGTHWRLAPQAYYYWGPFGLFGEYVFSNQRLRKDTSFTGGDGAGSFQNTAWQVAASYFLTGEENSFKAVAPKKAFQPANGGWGAWELAARVGELNLDDDIFALDFADAGVSASKAVSWGVGLNWHLNRNIKVQLTYDQTTFSGGTSPLLQNGEHVLFTRAQFSW
jgi:phosphate-selective porin OprO/OprP